MTRLRIRLQRATRTLVGAAATRSRDVVAAVGIGCVAIGLATWIPALAWIAVGGFLLFAAGSGRGRSA